MKKESDTATVAAGNPIALIEQATEAMRQAIGGTSGSTEQIVKLWATLWAASRTLDETQRQIREALAAKGVFVETPQNWEPPKPNTFIGTKQELDELVREKAKTN